MSGGSYQPSPLIYGDLLYVCSNNGVLTAYNARTGDRIYQQRIAGKGGAYSASPIASDGRIYLASEDGEVHVVKAGAQVVLGGGSLSHLASATIPEIIRRLAER